MFSRFVNKFRNDEDGAVTVDFVVLTAAIVGLSVAVLASVASGAVDRADRIQDCVDQGYAQLAVADDIGYLDRLQRAKDWCTDNTY